MAEIVCSDAAAFNQVDETSFSVFATVGGNFVNIYRIEEPEPEVDEIASDDAQVTQQLKLR